MQEGLGVRDKGEELRLHRKRTVAVAATILLVVGLLAWFREPVLVEMGRWLIVESPLREADLVVALGGDRERQEEAVWLSKQRLARWVLFVGSDVRPRDYECVGVPAGRAIPPPSPAYTTYEEAVVTRQVAEERGFKSVLIVTSPYHLRRARWTFEQVFKGTGATIMVSPSPNGAFSMEAWWKSHVGRKMVLMEYLDLAYYWLTV